MSNSIVIGSTFWLIAVRNAVDEDEFLREEPAFGDSAKLFPFRIPDFNVGTLEALINLSDELSRNDVFAENLLKKMAYTALEIAEGNRDKLIETLHVRTVVIDDYIKRFEWEFAKYGSKVPKTCTEIIMKQILQYDKDLKLRSAEYNNAKNRQMHETKKMDASLATRPLFDLVDEDNFVLNSEFMITVFVAVPKAFKDEWLKSYESMAEMVVPNSATYVHEDAEHILYNVTVFRKFLDDFRKKNRENRCIVRDFDINLNEHKNYLLEHEALNFKVNTEYVNLLKWLKINFTEAFTAWIHLKAIRIFVESVIRYGLPVNFKCVLVLPLKKNQKKIRELLGAKIKMYERRSLHPENVIDEEDVVVAATALNVANGEGKKEPLISYTDPKAEKQFYSELKNHSRNYELENLIGNQEFFPYVSLLINASLLE